MKKTSKLQHPSSNLQCHLGRARHSVRAACCQAKDGAHGVTRPTGLVLDAWRFTGCWMLDVGAFEKGWR